MYIVQNMHMHALTTSNSFNASFNMAPGSKQPIFNTPTEAATDNTTQGMLKQTQ